MAKLLGIDARTKRHPVLPARFDDFTCKELGPVDPEVVLRDPALSLYCIDPAERAATFVRTPPELDLSKAAFLYDAQFSSATEVVLVPFDEVHRLAEAAHVPSDRLVWVHSTGRCGSTLVSQVLAGVPGVVCLSEPDVYMQLHELRDSGHPELGALLRSCTVLLCAPRPASTWVFKFRSMNIELAESLLSAFPGSKTVFLYRGAESWARSAARAYGVFTPEMLSRWDQVGTVVARLRSLADSSKPLVWYSSPEDFLSWIWSTSMLRARALCEQGVPMFVARYEELTSRPFDVLRALLDYCGVAVSPEALREALERDSQDGTALSRTKAAQSQSELTEERRLDFLRCLAERAPSLDPDWVLPGSASS